MSKYDITFEYSEPRWATVEGIIADDDVEAEELAEIEFKKMYPEAIDPQVQEVIEV